MNEIDILWQSLLDEEKVRWSALPAEELRAMEHFTLHIVQRDRTQIEYSVWHENPDELHQATIITIPTPIPRPLSERA